MFMGLFNDDVEGVGGWVNRIGCWADLRFDQIEIDGVRSAIYGVMPVMNCFEVLSDDFSVVNICSHDKPAGPDTFDIGHIAAAVFDDGPEGNFPISRWDAPYFANSCGECLAKCNFMALGVGVGLWVAARAGEDGGNQ